MSVRRVLTIPAAMVIAVATMVFGLAVPSGAKDYQPTKDYQPPKDYPPTHDYPGTTLPPGFHCDGINGNPRVGEKEKLVIDGTGFYGQPKFQSTESGTKIHVDHVDGNHLVIDVTIKAGEPKGGNNFTITLANGKSANQHFFVK